MIKFGQLNENDIVDYADIIVRVKIEYSVTHNPSFRLISDDETYKPLFVFDEYILSLLRRYVEGDIYLDTIKATKERIIEKLMLGTFLGELSENPYCTIDETAIRR